MMDAGSLESRYSTCELISCKQVLYSTHSQRKELYTQNIMCIQTPLLSRVERSGIQRF